MNIGINASFLRKPGTGIGQVNVHFLRTLFSGDYVNDDDQVFLYLEEECDVEKLLGALPKNVHVKNFLPLWKRDDLVRKLWWEKFLLPQKVQRDHCDVLISLYQCATRITSTHTRHLMVVHDLIPQFFPQYIDNMRKRIYYSEVERGICGAHHIISVSAHTENDLVQRLHIKQDKITTALIAVDPLFGTLITDANKKRVREKYHLPEKYIYTGGGLEVRKNVESTIRAFTQLVHSGEHYVKLVISGRAMPGNALATDVDALITELGMEEHIHMIGFIAQKDLPALYAQALFFCYPSHYEGFGMPILEAMHAGVPVITAKNSSIPEVGGDTVLYANDNDVDDIARQMAILLRDDSRRKDLRTRAAVRAQQFSWDDFVAATINSARYQ